MAQGTVPPSRGLGRGGRGGTGERGLSAGPIRDVAAPACTDGRSPVRPPRSGHRRRPARSPPSRPAVADCGWRRTTARAVHAAGLVGRPYGDVVLDHALQRAHALFRPLVKPKPRPAAHQLEHPGLGIWLGGGERRARSRTARERGVVDHPGFVAQRHGLPVGQIGVQDDEQPDLLTAAFEFLRRSRRRCRRPVTSRADGRGPAAAPSGSGRRSPAPSPPMLMAGSGSGRRRPRACRPYSENLASTCGTRAR